MVEIYTGQYKYCGPDRLDITVKGKDPIGRIFAPTWAMVDEYKMFKDEEKYTYAYRNLMRVSYRRHRDVWEEVLRRDRVVLVCFCKAGEFCHRVLLAGYLEKLGGRYDR